MSLAQKAPPPPVLAAGGFRLEPFRPEDVREDYLAILNDPAVTRFLEFHGKPQTAEMAGAFVASFQGSAVRYMWAIREAAGGRLVGTATLFEIERQHGTARVGLMVDGKYWGHGASDAALRLTAEFAFGALGLRRVIGGSHVRNHGMNFTFKRLGWRREQRFVKALDADPSVTVDAFRWILDAVPEAA